MNQKISDNKESKIWRVLDASNRWIVWFVFLASFLIQIIASPFDSVFRFEISSYLLKAFEIANGNFLPTIPGANIGWPVLVALFIKLFHITNIFDAMVVARILGAACVASTVFPLARLASKLSDTKIAGLTIWGFALHPFIFTLAGEVEQGTPTEAMFLPLFIASIYFALRNSDALVDWSLASVFSALSLYVRPNGLFLLPILLLTA